ncbi:hypothetical protein LNP74_20955, partial [Klebsiella pneumoniae subsp. pneumoniae]|nr:hypothetical protein [Klebsiella pneumoniae subsp. pneumoniae]
SYSHFIPSGRWLVDVCRQAAAWAIILLHKIIAASGRQDPLCATHVRCRKEQAQLWDRGDLKDDVSLI